MKSLALSGACHAAQAAVETGASANGRSDSPNARLFVGSYRKVFEFHSDDAQQQSVPKGHMLRDSFSYPFGLIRKHLVQETFRWNCCRKFKARCQFKMLTGNG